DVLLLGVSRERHVPNGARAQSVLVEERLFDERAVLAKHLHAIVLAIADVDESVLRDVRAVSDVELLRRRRGWIVRGQRIVARLRAVRAPVPLVLPGVRVE